LKDHPLWKKAGRNVQDRINKMILPTKKGAEKSTTTRTIHQGRHNDKIFDRLEESMNNIMKKGEKEGYTQKQYEKELLDLIKDERQGLKSGETSLNKHVRM